VTTTNTFDATTGRLTNLRAGPSDAVASFDYQWDSIGNLIYRSDNDQGVIEKFCYDGLNRLTNSATGASGIASCTASGGGITTKTVGYDNLGNITSKSDVGTYSYPGVGSAQPHGVSSIAGTVNGVTNPAYTYDANGNMTAGAGRTVTYTAFNMADTITQGTTTDAFTYDDAHSRVTQVLTVGGTATTTTYLNDPISGAMGEKVVTGGTTTWHDFIQAGGALVAERFCTGAAPCSSGATWAYFVTDHLGSASVLTDGTGAVTERDSYDAWGRRRNPDGTDNAGCAITSTTTRGYTGHEMLDTVCQIDANARIYDPTIGRFLSADSTVQNPFDSQSFNRYSYVENGPLSATDPSGHDIPCFGCYGPGIEADSEGNMVSLLKERNGSSSSSGGGGVVVKDGTTGEIVGNCSTVADCGNLIDHNFSSVSSISSSIGTLTFGGSSEVGASVGGSGKAAPTGAGATGAGAAGTGGSSFSGGVETVVVTSTSLQQGTNGAPSDSFYNFGPTQSGTFDCGSRQCSFGMSSYHLGSGLRGARIVVQYSGSNKVNWIQTYTATGSGDTGQPNEDCAYTACPFSSSGGNQFYDEPGRYFTSGAWTAQTSIVRPNQSGGYNTIVTFTWGFQLSPDGVSLIAPHVVSPSNFQRQIVGSAHK